MHLVDVTQDSFAKLRNWQIFCCFLSGPQWMLDVRSYYAVRWIVVSELDYLGIMRMRQINIIGIGLRHVLPNLPYVILEMDHIISTYIICPELYVHLWGEKSSHTCALMEKVNAVGYIDFLFVFLL